jgi:tRNA threonylcarbamoyl adenosine modification protein YeaZ
MKILAFDTANNSASVTISEGQVILAYIEELRPSMQAETIVPMIEQVLKIAKLSYHDLEYLIVTNGPGSFTGIRIGLSVAQGIAVAANIKSTTISNLEYAYYMASTQVRNYNKMHILLNAYRNQLYSQIFTNNGEGSTPLLVSHDQAIESLSKENGLIICAGSGIELIYDQIKHLKNLIILPRFSRIKSFHICKYLAQKIPEWHKLRSTIEPLYIRPADAKAPKI